VGTKIGHADRLSGCGVAQFVELGKAVAARGTFLIAEIDGQSKGGHRGAAIDWKSQNETMRI
jgi:hypothetical protein